MSAKHALQRQKNFSPDAEMQTLVDRIIEEQSRLGVGAAEVPLI
jgi:hypothetical protein